MCTQPLWSFNYREDKEMSEEGDLANSPEDGDCPTETRRRQCRICLEDSDEEPLVGLSCTCKSDLALVHRSCGDRWFGNRDGASGTCEMCTAHAFDVSPSLVARARAAEVSANADVLRTVELLQAVLAARRRVPPGSEMSVGARFGLLEEVWRQQLDTNTATATAPTAGAEAREQHAQMLARLRIRTEGEGRALLGQQREEGEWEERGPRRPRLLRWAMLVVLAVDMLALASVVIHSTLLQITDSRLETVLVTWVGGVCVAMATVWVFRYTDFVYETWRLGLFTMITAGVVAWYGLPF